MGEDGRANVYCKISGLVTEADFEAWTEAQLQPYLETVLEAFEPNRLMFASDWPVCLEACNYQRWYDIVCRFAASLSPEERGSLFGRTAARAYNLHVPDDRLPFPVRSRRLGRALHGGRGSRKLLWKVS